MDFMHRIRENNEKRGHHANPYMFMHVNEQAGYVSWEAVKDVEGGKIDVFKGSDPITEDVDDTVKYVVDLVKLWGRGDGVWIEYRHSRKPRIIPPPEPKQQADTLEVAIHNIANKYGDLIDDEQWDELVHDAASNIGSRINNGDREDQIEFLIGELGDDYLARVLEGCLN